MNFLLMFLLLNQIFCLEIGFISENNNDNLYKYFKKYVEDEINEDYVITNYNYDRNRNLNDLFNEINNNIKHIFSDIAFNFNEMNDILIKKNMILWSIRPLPINGCFSNIINFLSIRKIFERCILI